MSSEIPVFEGTAYVCAPTTGIVSGVRLVTPVFEQSVTVVHPRGDVANPMGRDEIRQKLANLAQGRLTDDALRSILSGVDLLNSGPGDQLLAALSRPGCRATGIEFGSGA